MIPSGGYCVLFYAARRSQQHSDQLRNKLPVCMRLKTSFPVVILCPSVSQPWLQLGVKDERQA